MTVADDVNRERSWRAAIDQSRGGDAQLLGRRGQLNRDSAKHPVAQFVRGVFQIDFDSHRPVGPVERIGDSRDLGLKDAPLQSIQLDDRPGRRGRNRERSVREV